MQTLVNAVRGTGATNILLLGGVAYSNSLAQWVQYAPTDPLNNTGAAWHSYNFNYCNSQTCWDQYVAPVASRYHPVVVTEFGENDCQGTYVAPLMQWLDSKNISTYFAWTFNPWDCSSGPALISSYSNNGTPTTYGQSVKTYYGQFAVTYNYVSNSTQPSVNSTQLPTTSNTQQPTTSNTQQPTTSSTQQPTSTSSTPKAGNSTKLSGIRVAGNHIVNQQGQIVKLRVRRHKCMTCNK